MLGILQDDCFNQHYAHGFIETDIILSNDLIEEIRQYYQAKQFGHNDFYKFFKRNEHLAYMEGKIFGFLLNTFQKYAEKTVKNYYQSIYNKAVYCEQFFIEKVLLEILEKGLGKLIKSRYILASYDMYLCSNHMSPAAGIHTDFPNFHHFYETENDLSIYIPLVDLNEKNGGRLKVLPEMKLKVPGNVLLSMLYQYFSKNSNHLDQNGYVIPEKIKQSDLNSFIKSTQYKKLMLLYKNITEIAKTQYKNCFIYTNETRGKVLIFNNKNFHSAEKWKNESTIREIYVIRMFPIYDIQIKLKAYLHGKLFNNFLLDLKTNSVNYYNAPVDFSEIPKKHKLTL